jgi:hypothetical protein
VWPTLIVPSIRRKICCWQNSVKRPRRPKTTQPHIHAGNGNFVADGIRQALMARAGFEGQERITFITV